MTTECSLAQERLLELLEVPDPSDPEEVVLAPLRQHLMACNACQVEAAELRGLLWLDREAAELLPDEAEFAVLEAGMAARREEFLQFVRSHSAPRVVHCADGRRSVEERPGLDTRLRRAVDTVAGWSLTLPPLQLPRLSPLAAADTVEPPETPPEQLFQVWDDRKTALIELLLAGAESQLFVTVYDPLPREGDVRVTLMLESGQSVSRVLGLRDGLGIWNLPSDLMLEGTCSIRVDPAIDPIG